MSAGRIDSETLAALLDGKLEAAERDRVLRILADHPEEYEVFADAVGALRAMESALTAGSALPRVIPIEGARRSRRWLLGGAAIAAAALVGVAVSRLGKSKIFSPIAVAAGIDLGVGSGDGSLASKLGDSWDQPGWSVTRGSGQELIESARAFRMGVRATDVEMAIKAKDASALKLVGAELVELASGVEAGGPAAALYQRVLDEGVPASDDDRRQAADAIRGLTGESPWFDLGVWAEGQRLLERSPSGQSTRDTRRALQRVIGRFQSATVGDVDAVRPLLTQILAKLETNPSRPNADDLLRQVVIVAGR